MAQPIADPHSRRKPGSTLRRLRRRVSGSRPSPGMQIFWPERLNVGRLRRYKTGAATSAFFMLCTGTGQLLGRLGVSFLLRLSRAIDGLNERVGKLVYWLILAAVVVSAGN